MEQKMVFFESKRSCSVFCVMRAFLIIPIIFVNTSESPDRNCCEPLYPFILSTQSPTSTTEKHLSRFFDVHFDKIFNYYMYFRFFERINYLKLH